jgi:hypothetical protein
VQSVEYFYPIKDREQAAKRTDRLGAKLAEMPSLKNRSTDLAHIKAELANSKN